MNRPAGTPSTATTAPSSCRRARRSTRASPTPRPSVPRARVTPSPTATPSPPRARCTTSRSPIRPSCEEKAPGIRHRCAPTNQAHIGAAMRRHQAQIGAAMRVAEWRTHALAAPPHASAQTRARPSVRRRRGDKPQVPSTAAVCPHAPPRSQSNGGAVVSAEAQPSMNAAGCCVLRAALPCKKLPLPSTSPGPVAQDERSQ